MQSIAISYKPNTIRKDWRVGINEQIKKQMKSLCRHLRDFTVHETSPLFDSLMSTKTFLLTQTKKFLFLSKMFQISKFAQLLKKKTHLAYLEYNFKI